MWQGCPVHCRMFSISQDARSIRTLPWVVTIKNVSRHKQYLWEKRAQNCPWLRIPVLKKRHVETLTFNFHWALVSRTKLKSQWLSPQHLAVRCVGCCPLSLVLSWRWGIRSVLYGSFGLTGNFPVVRVVLRWNELPQSGWSPLMGQPRHLLFVPPEPSPPFLPYTVPSLTCRTPLMVSLSFWLLVGGREEVRLGHLFSRSPHLPRSLWAHCASQRKVLPLIE